MTPTGGTAPYAYLWDNTETGMTATMLDAGTHTVTVTDANDCETTCTVIITEPEVLACTTSLISNASCNGFDDGSASVTPSGGTGPFTYLWDNNETGQTATMLDAGTHTVTVTDANDCETTCTIDISEPDVLACTTSLISNASCNGFDDGSASVTPTGGTGPYTCLLYTSTSPRDS